MLSFITEYLHQVNDFLYFDCWCANLALVYFAAIIVTLVPKYIFRPGYYNYKGKHVVVIGGSQGLGLDTAKCMLVRGATVTIVSRKKSKLEAAKKYLEKELGKAETRDRIYKVDCDVTDFEKCEEMLAAMHDKIDVLVNCAGMARPGYFYDQDINDYYKSVNLNYLGSVNTTKVVLEDMIKHGVKDAKFIFVASAICTSTIVGYSQYAASKQALRGFCDALRAELVSYGYSSHIYYASNIDSPGFVTESKTKPEATKIIEGSGSLESPEDVAKCMLSNIDLGHYHFSNDVLVYLTRVSMNGLNPRNNVLLEWALTPLISIFVDVFGVFADQVLKNYPPPLAVKLCKQKSKKG